MNASSLKIGIASKPLSLTTFWEKLLPWNSNRCEIIIGTGNRLDADRSAILMAMKMPVRKGCALLFIDSDVIPSTPLDDCMRYMASDFAHGYDVVTALIGSPQGTAFCVPLPKKEVDDVKRAHLGFTALSPKLIEQMKPRTVAPMQDGTKIEQYFWYTPEFAEDLNFFIWLEQNGYRACVDMRLKVRHLKLMQLEGKLP